MLGTRGGPVRGDRLAWPLVPPLDSWTTRAARADDVGWMTELRVEVLRRDLERIGVFDPVRSRRRFTDAYRPELTTVIELAGSPIGLIAARPEPDAVWIEHFYLAAAAQGRGIGSAMLAAELARTAGPLPHRLVVLRGSAARRLYERSGFAPVGDDGVDVTMERAAAR
jgi:GNAT superfamily N-acetyltransferase